MLWSVKWSNEAQTTSVMLPAALMSENKEHTQDENNWSAAGDSQQIHSYPQTTCDATKLIFQLFRHTLIYIFMKHCTFICDLKGSTSTFKQCSNCSISRDNTQQLFNKAARISPPYFSHYHTIYFVFQVICLTVRVWQMSHPKEPPTNHRFTRPVSFLVQHIEDSKIQRLYCLSIVI